MRALLAVLAFFALLAQSVRAAEGRAVTLALPHPLGACEKAVLEVEVGVIAKGAEIQVTTSSGRFIGAISPYGIRSGHPAGSYMVPLPTEAISDNHASLLLSIHQNGKTRAPTAHEIKRLHLKIAPCSAAGPQAKEICRIPLLSS